MKKVSSKTHTKKQLDDYANQNNPNNKAYKSRKMNEKRMKSKKKVLIHMMQVALIWNGFVMAILLILSDLLKKHLIQKRCFFCIRKIK